MFKYDLHVHSNHSHDCDLKIDKLVRMAKQRGLNGIAITDHDTVTGALSALERDLDINIIPGIERTLWDGTHLIGLFIKENITADTPLSVAEEIKAQGGFVLIPHPFRSYSGIFGSSSKINSSEKKRLLEVTDFFEIFNLKCTPYENYLAKNLATKENLTWSVGSDAHKSYNIGAAQNIFSTQFTIENRIPVAVTIIKGGISQEKSEVPLNGKFVFSEFPMNKTFNILKLIVRFLGLRSVLLKVHDKIIESKKFDMETIKI